MLRVWVSWSAHKVAEADSFCWHPSRRPSRQHPHDKGYMLDCPRQELVEMSGRKGLRLTFPRLGSARRRPQRVTMCPDEVGELASIRLPHWENCNWSSKDQQKENRQPLMDCVLQRTFLPPPPPHLSLGGAGAKQRQRRCITTGSTKSCSIRASSPPISGEWQELWIKYETKDLKPAGLSPNTWNKTALVTESDCTVMGPE